mmetsp:Transcript_51241/g.158758  ORF Transcript_51241/g.158758 Transcript_51241/m.158758 type:complete len:207 (+) Transcript_51241:81-701(+)
MSAGRPLLGTGNTLQILETQEQLVDKLWFQSMSAVPGILLMAYAGYAGYTGLGIECPPGPLAAVLLAKAALFLVIIILELGITMKYRRSKESNIVKVGPLMVKTVKLDSNIRGALKRALQCQQVVFFMNVFLSIFGYFVTIKAVGGWAFLSAFWQFPASGTECGPYPIDAMSYFAACTVGSGVMLMVKGPSMAWDLLLKMGHFLPF